MIAGIYPAIVMSGYKPVEVLKGKLNMKTGNGWLRQGLVVVQFATAIAMIGSMFIIGKQMKYLRNKDLGYDREQVVIVPTNKPRAEGLQMARLYSNELLKHAEVADVTVSIFSFAEPAWAELGYTDEKRVYKSFQFNAVDANFIKAMQIDMASGRNFSADNPADITSSAIVNEAFVQEFGLSDPVGKKLPGRFDQQIIGVTKDFNFQSLHTKVRPLMMVIQPDSIMRRSENISFVASPQPRISVRLKAGNTAAGIDILRNAWKVVAPNQDFEYRFLDESINAQYKAEQRTSSIVSIASILAVFIACMGLFGLATLAVVKRTKEIGIRKVLGASVTNITVLLSKDFIKLVAIAGVIAFPPSWWFMSDWLRDFAYRTDISWWVFAVSSIAAMLIALLTVSFQAVKAAIANPVESLRSE